VGINNSESESENKRAREVESIYGCMVQSSSLLLLLQAY